MKKKNWFIRELIQLLAQIILAAIMVIVFIEDEKINWSIFTIFATLYLTATMIAHSFIEHSEKKKAL